MEFYHLVIKLLGYARWASYGVCACCLVSLVATYALYKSDRLKCSPVSDKQLIVQRQLGLLALLTLPLNVVLCFVGIPASQVIREFTPISIALVLTTVLIELHLNIYLKVPFKKENVDGTISI